MKFLLLLCLFTVTAFSAGTTVDLSDVRPAWQQPKYILSFLRIYPHLPTRGIDGRIYGGQVASPGQFPHMVSNVFTTSTGRYFCGGSLIALNFVLTAAHCADDASSFTFTFGAHDRSQTEEGTQVLIVDGNYKFVHELWNSNTLQNDVAVIRLPTPVTLTDRIKVIALPTINQANEGYLFSDWQATISGWGGTETGSTTVLLYVTNDILSPTECSNQGVTVWTGMMCFSATDGKGTCNGDSGSPLIVQDGDVLRQVGVHSFGVNGCGSEFPKGLSRVTHYLTWILEKLNAVELKN